MYLRAQIGLWNGPAVMIQIWCGHYEEWRNFRIGYLETTLDSGKKIDELRKELVPLLKAMRPVIEKARKFYLRSGKLGKNWQNKYFEMVNGKLKVMKDQGNRR